MEQIKLCFSLLDPPGKRRVWALGGLLFINVILEVSSIGLIMPFITFMSAPGIVRHRAIMDDIYRLGNFSSTDQFLIWFGSFLFVMILIKNLYAHWLTRFQSRFVYDQIAKISERLFKRYLRAPYEAHLTRNSAELVTNIDFVVERGLTLVLLPTLYLCTEFSVVIAIILLMFVLAPLPTTTLCFVVLGSSWALITVLRHRLVELGKVTSKSQESRQLWLQHALSGIKEVKLLGRESYFLRGFSKARQEYSAAQAQALYLTEASRPVLEIMLVGGLIAATVVFLMQGASTGTFIGLMSLFAAGTFRVMPAASRAVKSFNQIKNGKAQIEQMARELINPDLNEVHASSDQALSLQHAIDIQDVSFTYKSATRPSLRGVTVSIRHGEAVGIVGPSGAGKSTLIDVILGVLSPQRGRVLVDGQDVSSNTSAWQHLIGYVPQSITLMDDTVRANVAFGCAPCEIDDAAVWRALEHARIAELVRSFPGNLNTKIGEHGVRLSGGERQRLGIARALYHNPAVLVLDEATSALDNATEKEITLAIERLHHKKTILVIAHRLTTVKNCDRIICLENGSIVDSGKFEQLADRNDAFRQMVRLADIPVPAARADAR